jgi:hypothetical protein
VLASTEQLSIAADNTQTDNTTGFTAEGGILYQQNVTTQADGTTSATVSGSDYNFNIDNALINIAPDSTVGINGDNNTVIIPDGTGSSTINLGALQNLILTVSTDDNGNASLDLGTGTGGFTIADGLMTGNSSASFTLGASNTFSLNDDGSLDRSPIQQPVWRHPQPRLMPKVIWSMQRPTPRMAS